MTIHTSWLLALTLTLMVGCSETDGQSTQDQGADADVDADADSDSDSDTDFLSTFNIVAPEGRTGTFYMTDEWFSVNKRDDDIVCADTEECIVEVTKTDDYDIWFDGGEGYDSLTLAIEVMEKDHGMVFDLAWGEGEHGLTPEGVYSGSHYSDLEIFTGWEDDQLTINLDIGSHAIVTGSTFAFDEDGDMVEGTITEDRTEIWLHVVYNNGEGNEREDTLSLE
jgi:hypothetical protein